jgi:PAS domain S-box-containing protein
LGSIVAGSYRLRESSLIVRAGDLAWDSVGADHLELGTVYWRALVEASPDVVLVVEPSGTIVFTNRVDPVFAGRQIVGRPIWEFAVGDARQRLTEKVREVVETQKAVIYENPGFRSDGSEGWYEVRAIPVLVDGRVDRIIWASTDITERKKAVAELEARERRFRALVDHGSDCITLIGADGKFSYASPAIRAMGYEPEELLGRTALDYVHPDDRATAFAAGRGSAPSSCTHATLRLLHKDGSWRWHEGTSTNLLHDPAVRAIVSNRRDVTDRKNEEARRAFQAQVLAQVSQPVVATDITEIITYWNEAAERLFGFSAAEALGRNGSELLKSRWAPEAYDAMVAALKSQASAWQGELHLTTKAGEPVTVEASVRLVRDDTGKPLRGITVMQDVTASRHLQEQLRQSQKMEAIGLLAGGVAHDFNNLLAVILGFSELASRKLPPGHPVAQQLSEVFEAARRGGELTRKLLAFSRKQIIQPRPLDVRSSVDDFTRMIRRIVGEDVELVVERADEALAVRADPVQLEQVLLNLCTNARQAMPEGGTLRLTTRATAFDDAFVARHPWARGGSFAEIAVSDTGVGMDTKTRARIFEPFFTTKREGTGLGLSTVYGIVQQHGGFIHVESAPREGTTFRVFLPRTGDSAPVSRTTNGVHLSPSSSGREVVLVAEDEPALRALVTMTLTELGYRVIAVSDGEEAVHAYEEHAREVDLVVLDVVMPRLDAREAYERIRAVRPDVKVLFTTGYAPASTRLAQLLESGRVPVLEKPFTPLALAAKVRSAIDAAFPSSH